GLPLLGERQLLPTVSAAGRAGPVLSQAPVCGETVGLVSNVVYGPVCIARSQRARGLLRSLYQELLSALGATYDLGVALISKNNPRSLEAHVRKLGMTPVGEYEFRGQQYDIVAFHIPNLHDQTNTTNSIYF
ncbi:MAG: hypothetical protein ABI980_12835, partial [Nitrospirota bacterium]